MAASGAVALVFSLVAAIPVFAESEGTVDANVGIHGGLRARLLELRKDHREERKDKREDRKDERKDQRDLRKEERKEKRDERKEHRDIVRAHAGIVTRFDGSTFLIDPFGKLGTTTVTTNASTTFKVRDHATSSAALHVGSHVIVIGPLSTSTNTIAANSVIILNAGWGWLKHFFLR
ncbi:hypothetical protein HY970_00955 [Candidatus Kaiserbacteria bacterium]|nr:hypothetical protein [Candidatus Kaiserbacteria bacterium]